MSIDIYVYSYSKSVVKESVRQAWDNQQFVDHVDDIFGEISDQGELLWTERLSFCWNAFNKLKTELNITTVCGSSEFAINKEHLTSFKQYIEELDKPTPQDDWKRRALEELQRLIETFDFESNYLTMHTD
ncbi:hypothetical protein ID964_004477 [Salmonella enterica]|nr:hypothetical protein [Salmonella enterica]